MSSRHSPGLEPTPAVIGWDAAQYDRYADHRGRPFHELVARVVAALGDRPAPRAVVDLGCGPGSLTATLATRWLDARILGVDASSDMLAAAAAHTIPGRLEFVAGDLATWEPPEPVDVIVANAAFQWVPGHLALMPRLAAQLRRGGVLGFQVPDNYHEPSHTLLLEQRLSPTWRGKLAVDADRSNAVERPIRYLQALAEAGFDPDVWQTEYFQVLTGDDPVLEWIKGTAMRPVLSALDDEAERAAFVAELAPKLREAYPADRHGRTVLPFRRTFAVGRLP